jgi:phosphoglycolate phosphatase
LAIFDLDGTLVDSRADIGAALNAALRDAGLPEHGPTEVAGMIGDGVARLVERALGRAGHPAHADVVAGFRRHYQTHLVDKTVVYAGMAELLARAHQAGVHLAVATNKPTAFAEQILAVLGLRPQLEVVLGEDGSHPRKPDPASIRTILARTGWGTQDALYVGDSLVDLATGRNAGVAVALVTWGYTARERLFAARPEHLIDHAAELASLILPPDAPA